jgi:hypothetical protein
LFVCDSDRPWLQIALRVIANVSASWAPRAQIARALFTANAPNPVWAAEGGISCDMQHQPVEMPENKGFPALKASVQFLESCPIRQLALADANGKRSTANIAPTVIILTHAASNL